MVGRPPKSRLRSSPATSTDREDTTTTHSHSRSVRKDHRSEATPSARKEAVRLVKKPKARQACAAAATPSLLQSTVEVVLDDEDVAEVEDTTSGDLSMSMAPTRCTSAPTTQDTVVACSSPRPQATITCVSDGDVHELVEEAEGGEEAVWVNVATSISSDDSNSDETPLHRSRARGAAAQVNAVARDRVFSSASSSPAVAAILRASSLPAYFTYGFEAALQHYAGDQCGEEEEEEEEHEDKKGRGERRGGLRRTAARYRNAFLLAQGGTRIAEGNRRPVDYVSRSSSAATYDSDAAEEVTEHLLEPQCTSLYRAAPSSEAARAKAGTSWSTHAAVAAVAAAPASTVSRSHPVKVSLNDAFPSRQAEWTSGGAAACFGEALRRAYVCEDAVRQRQHNAADRHRRQLIHTLAKLHGSVSGGGSGEGGDSSLAASKRAVKRAAPTAVPRGASLSSLADAVEKTTETAPAISAKKGAKPAVNGRQNRDVSDVLYSLESNDSHSSAAASTAPSVPRCDPSARRVLQLVDPAQLHTLRRTPNVLVDTILKQHREALAKQRGARHAAEQTTHLRRRYELPVLTEDTTRYAALLLCLKRPQRRAIAPAPEGGGEGEPSSGSDVEGLRSPLGTNGTSPTPATVETGDATPPYGEEGSLLYLKYPAPLLRTTSFAVETVRLLKWLRTWRNSGGVGSGGGGSPSTASSSSAAPAGGRAKGSASANQRKCAKVETPAPAPAVATPPPASRSPIEEVQRQAQVSQQLAEAQAKEEKRTSFMKFFGTAVKAPPVVKVGDSEVDGVAATVSRPATCFHPTAQSLPVSISLQSRSTETAAHTLQQQLPLLSSSSTTTTSPPMRALSPSLQLSESTLISSPAYAYQLYCLAWRHAVKTGITPLATAVQAFAGGQQGALATATRPPVAAIPRVCAALPFYKDVAEAAQRTALGSADRDVYYEDAYGNRLRSARLAQKEREKQEQLAAQQRRWAKKKGYFHRAETEDGGLLGCRSAAAMLDAMRSPAGSEVSAAPTAPSRKRRRRVRETSSDEETSTVRISDEEEEGAVVVRPRASRPGRPHRAAGSHSKVSSSGSDRSSRSSSSSGSSSRGGGAHDADAAGPGDEITNIAVVSGPTGAGKTAAVHVAAQLLGFRVVEMNASVRRCAKTVEHLLAELTRSYRLSGLRSGAAAFNAEEELTRLKMQHAAAVEKARAEAEAAEQEAEQRRREARKANGISAKAVANFFSRNAPEKPTSRRTTGTTVVEDVEVEDADAMTSPPTASVLAPPPPLQVTPAAAASPVGTRTLLLFEDADILLGDESARPFYAAIRDLAHRSKVPIVVTVSAEPSSSQRYDIPPPPPPPEQHVPQYFTEKCHVVPESSGSASSPSPLLATYWQACEAAGLNTPMDAIEAAFQALQASPVLDNRTSTADTGSTGGGGGGGGGGGANDGSHSGGGTSPHQISAAASLSSFFPSTKTAAAAASSPTTGVGVVGNASSPSSLSAGAVTAAAGGAATSPLAGRYTHVLLNASLVSSFFGTRTPFTVVEALPPSALFAQLLAVGAVELDLLQWQPPADTSVSQRQQQQQQQPCSGSRYGPLLSSVPSSASSWQQDVDRLTGQLTVRDTPLFFELARRLCEALFGAPAVACVAASLDAAAGDAERAAEEAGLQGGLSLSSALQCDAAHQTTTDVRYWLNRLQMLLLSLKASPVSTTAVGGEEVTVDGEGVDGRCGGVEERVRSRRAECLLEGDFEQRTSLVASEWDCAMGRYSACLAHNEQQSSRYEYWLLDDHVEHTEDIVGELNAQDHPTLRIDYTAARTAAAAAAAVPRCGRPPSASKARAAASPSSAGVRSACVKETSPPANGTGGGLNPAWKALFSGASPTTPCPSPAPMPQSSLPGGQQTLFGFPPRGAPITGSLSSIAATAGAGAVVVDPSRYVWPPSQSELRRQMHRSASSRLRPVEVVLPYGTAQAYYDVAATSSTAADMRRVPDTADPSPYLLGHDTALRFVNRQGGREMEEEDGDVADVTRELPSSVYVTQKERAAVLRRWWKRTRKVGALRDHVVGRSGAALEDVLGYSRLLSPSSSLGAASGGNGGA